MIRDRAIFTLLALMLALAEPAAAQQKNIFDDVWEAPKAKPAEAKSTLPPPPARAEPMKPDTPPATTTDPAPKVVSVTLPLPVPRRPVPGQSEQAAVRKVMKELFAPQLADRTPAGRKALFTALIAQAQTSKDIPAEQFVVLAAAHDAAIGAGELALVDQAADDLGRHFDVDALAIKAAAAPAVLRPGSAPKEAVADNIRAALALAQALATAGDYANAVKIAQAASPAAVASGDPALRTQATIAVRDFSALRDTAARIARDIERLATTPDDPAANLAVGKHWCFDLGSWPAGLPKLAKGSDPALKALAAQELADPKGADKVSALADGWWDTAAKLPEGLAKSNVTAHAAAIYERALPGLTGMKKQLAERRAVPVGAPAVAAVKMGTTPAVGGTGKLAATDTQGKPLAKLPKDRQYAELVTVATNMSGGADPRKAALASLASGYPGDSDVAALMFEKAGQIKAHYDERKTALVYLDSYVTNNPRVTALMKARAMEEGPVHYDERKTAVRYLARINDDPEVVAMMMKKVLHRAAHSDERKLAVSYLAARGPKEKGVVDMMKKIVAEHDWAHSDERRAAVAFLTAQAPTDPEVRKLMTTVVTDPPAWRHHEEIKMAKAFLAKAPAAAPAAAPDAAGSFTPVGGTWVKIDSGTRFTFAADSTVSAPEARNPKQSKGTWTLTEGKVITIEFPDDGGRIHMTLDGAGKLSGKGNWTLRRE